MTNRKLEALKRIYNLGEVDIAAMFRSEHIRKKYDDCREKDGQHGNFSFLFRLDETNAAVLFYYIGFDDIDLVDKRR